MSMRIAGRPMGRLARPALAAAVLALAACGGEPSQNPLNLTAPCPRIGLIGDAADLTRHAGPGRDLTTLVLDARIAGFNAKCDFASRNSGIDVTLSPIFEVERGPAAQSRTAEFTYIVAVMDASGQAIQSREAFPIRASFPPNAPRVRDDSERITIRIPGNPAEVRNRRVLIGFQLTEAELALNRARGPR
ncbi:hypothetical protein [Humitalea rosea]|nr:hypothetical protein [Humitalea rosea]